jgi:hypothetical protein
MATRMQCHCRNRHQEHKFGQRSLSLDQSKSFLVVHAAESGFKMQIKYVKPDRTAETVVIPLNHGLSHIDLKNWPTAPGTRILLEVEYWSNNSEAYRAFKPHMTRIPCLVHHGSLHIQVHDPAMPPVTEDTLHSM